MQDFKTYNYTLTIEDLKKALEDGQHITAIINGEYYDIQPHRKKETVKSWKLKILKSG